MAACGVWPVRAKCAKRRKRPNARVAPRSLGRCRGRRNAPRARVRPRVWLRLDPGLPDRQTRSAIPELQLVGHESGTSQAGEPRPSAPRARVGTQPRARILHDPSCAHRRSRYDGSMTVAKVAITLPKEQLARVRRAVRSGQAQSVSGYITRALEEHEQRESLRSLIDDLIDEHGTPTKEERAWARRALARRPRG